MGLWARVMAAHHAAGHWVAVRLLLATKGLERRQRLRAALERQRGRQEVRLWLWRHRYPVPARLERRIEAYQRRTLRCADRYWRE